jgi:tellurite resistance protein
MSDSNAPLDRIRRAHEEDYFQKQNQALIAAMKQKLEVQAAAEGLGATTGITDNALLERLANFGFDAETAAVIHLVPLIEVAWASGEIEPDEKELLLEAATAHGVTGGAAKAKFDSMLAAAPPAEMLDAALDFIKALLVALPDDQSEEACLGLTELSYKIAEANGGVFGLFFKVDDEEKAVLRRIAERLSASHPEAAQRLIGRL